MNAETDQIALPQQAKLPSVKLPDPVQRRGITEAQWRTAMNSLFPGAKSESVIAVFDYCAARGLDPLKKPCHIVPMQVKNQNGDYEWRDVIMPGIYEYRTTATRTGLYLGHSVPVYGPIVDFKGRQVPSSCAITVYRWNSQAGLRGEYPVELLFEETCATKRDGSLNQRWATAPRQMLTKCTEAAALREAFPDELGGTHTVEEMDGRTLEPINVTHEPQRLGVDPRPDTSAIPVEWIDEHVSNITDIISQSEKEKMQVSEELNAYVAEAFANKEELYCAVFDALKDRKIINKGDFRKLLQIANGGREHHA